MTYDFRTQFKDGEHGEQTLDRYFSRWYDIEPVSMKLQHYGIDRLFISKEQRLGRFVEYKTDTRAAATGNAFIETISVDSEGKPGWAYTSCADLLMYYIPPRGELYIIEPRRLPNLLTDWRRRFAERAIPNKGYMTRGVIVPLTEFPRAEFKLIRDVR